MHIQRRELLEVANECFIRGEERRRDGIGRVGEDVVSSLEHESEKGCEKKRDVKLRYNRTTKGEGGEGKEGGRGRNETN